MIYIKKESILLDNLKNCKGSASYIHQLLLGINNVLSVRINLEQGLVEVYYNGPEQRTKFIQILAQKGFPEAGTATCKHKGKAIINSTIGMLI